MKSKSVGNFSQKSTDCGGHSLKCISKNLWSQSVVGFLIWSILDHGQRHLVDFWEKFPTDLDFIWIEQTSYNSGVLFQIVCPCISIFKLKSSSREGCLLHIKKQREKKQILLMDFKNNFPFFIRHKQKNYLGFLKLRFKKEKCSTKSLCM